MNAVTPHDDAGRSTSPVSAELHTVDGIQRYTAQLGRLTTALEDDAVTKRLIEAVHTGRGAAVERLFQEFDVDTQVSIATLDEPSTEDTGPEKAQRTAAAAAKPRVTTVTISIGIGPFSISVSYKKETKS